MKRVDVHVVVVVVVVDVVDDFHDVDVVDDVHVVVVDVVDDFHVIVVVSVNCRVSPSFPQLLLIFLALINCCYFLPQSSIPTAICGRRLADVEKDGVEMFESTE